MRRPSQRPGDRYATADGADAARCPREEGGLLFPLFLRPLRAAAKKEMLVRRRPRCRARFPLVLVSLPFLVSGLVLTSPGDASAVPIRVDFSSGDPFSSTGSLGLFNVSTGTETFLLSSPPYSLTVEGDFVEFGETLGGTNVGGLAFQFTSFSSGSVIDTAPFDSVAYLEFVAGDLSGFLGTGYRARLTEGNVLTLSYQILGIPGSQSSPVTFTFTAVPEPSAACLVGLGAALLASRLGRRHA